MSELKWADELPISVTVSDNQGIIIYMNQKSVSTFSKDGGKKLIGQNLNDCHSSSSQKKIKKLLESNSNNIYTIQKNNKKKMIVQMPWYKDDHIMGLVEFSIELPQDIPHFNRD